MMHFMNLDEVKQNNMGRVKLNIEKFVQEVRRNDGRILFDAVGYRRYVDEETRANEYIEVEQIRRPKVITSVPPPVRPVEQSDTGSDTGYYSEKPRHQGYQGSMNPRAKSRRGKTQGTDGRKPQSDDYYGPSSHSFRKQDRSPSNHHDYYGPSTSNLKREPSPAHGPVRGAARGYADVEGDRFHGPNKKPRVGRSRNDDGRNSRGLNSLQWEDPPSQQHDNLHRNRDIQWEDPPQPNLRWEAPPKRDEHQKVDPFTRNASRGYNI
jgi:hypothetical protein